MVYRRRFLHLILPLIFLIAAQFALQIRARYLDSVYVEEPERASSWDPNLFRILSFGHIAPMLDWLWIQTLTDPSISHVIKGTHPKVYYDLDLATEIDPAFFELYYAGSNLLAVIRNDGPGARDLLLKGNAFRKTGLSEYSKEFREAHWGYPWVLPLMLAYVYLFELEDLMSASQAFREAAQEDGSPPYLKSLVQRFEKPGGEYEVGKRLLTFMVASTKDPRVREELEEKLHHLAVSQFLFEINFQFKAFREKAGKPGADPRGLWLRFLAKSGLRDTDPWGGRLSLSAAGKIITSTPRKRVLGLE